MFTAPRAQNCTAQSATSQYVTASRVQGALPYNTPLHGGSTQQSLAWEDTCPAITCMYLPAMADFLQCPSCSSTYKSSQWCHSRLVVAVMLISYLTDSVKAKVLFFKKICIYLIYSLSRPLLQLSLRCSHST